MSDLIKFKDIDDISGDVSDLIKFKDIDDINGDMNNIIFEYDSHHLNNTFFDFKKVIISKVKDHIISKVIDNLMFKKQQIYTMNQDEYYSLEYHIYSKNILTNYRIFQEYNNLIHNSKRCDITGLDILTEKIYNKRLLLSYIIGNSKIFFDDIYIGYETKTIEEYDKFYMDVNFKYNITNLQKFTLVEKDDNNYGYYLKQKRKELLNGIN